MSAIFFLLTDNILNPANTEVVFPEGALIDMEAVRRLEEELGIDNFSAQVCLGWSAASTIQQGYLEAYFPEEANQDEDARLHPGFWPEE